MPLENKLTASQEDYLEAIYNIVDDKMAARAKDIAEYLAVRASSVTGALRTLRA
ncbi:MAG: metal-dependent transcriptional regulator, partial [Candidatus Electrothrix sp. EH2]|nr:metal-dependent transcriptional regulator [Candidatus Electrothrix sp. EH2]